MPAEDAHFDQAVHNQQFVESLDVDSTEYLDWVVVGAFYAAVHLVERFLAQYNSHPESHRQRCNAMASIETLKPVFKDYRELYTESEDCRYLCRIPSRNHVRDSVLPKLYNIRHALNTT